MQTLGTVLPTKQSLASTKEWYKAQQAKKARVESLLTGTRKVVGGEVRFYKTSKLYHTVGSDAKVREFEVRKDGDYFKRFVQI